MGMDRLPGPICNESRPVFIDPGTMTLSASGTQAIMLEQPADIAALLRIHKESTGPAACVDWNELARLRDAIRKLPPGGYGGVSREELLQSLYGTIVVAAAEEHLDVREEGKNAGDDVEEMLEAVGREAGDAWCAAFVAQVHRFGAQWMCAVTTCPQEAAVQFLWGSARAAGLFNYTKDDVLSQEVTPRRGDVFIMAKGSSYDALKAMKKRLWSNDVSGTHTGVVAGYDAASQALITIEGNTGPAGGREGDGVYIKERPLLKSPKASAMTVLAFFRPGVLL